MKDYTYIGKILTSEAEPRPEIEKDTNANRACYALLPPLESQSVPRAEKKIKIHKTLIRRVATNRAESWTLNKDIAKRLAAFHGKVLGRILGELK